MSSNQNKNYRVARLRAFVILNGENVRLSDSGTDIAQRFHEAIKNLKVNGRRLPLNPEEVGGDEDVLSWFWYRDGIFEGTLMRLKNAGRVKILTQEMLDAETISPPDAESGDIACTDYFYFAFDGNFLVTSLRGNASIKPLETYISHFSGVDGICLLPKMHRLSDVDFSGVKEIQFSQDQKCAVRSPGVESVLKDIPSVLLGKILQSGCGLDQIKQNVTELVSAKVLLSFKKPSGMTDLDYENGISSILGSVSSPESLKLIHRRFGTIEATKFLEKKEVKVKLTPFGNFVEPELFVELRKFLKELEL